MVGYSLVVSIIAVFNQKGGVGKTTTALNLLAAIGQRKQRPLAIDLDPQCHLSQIFGVHPRTADDSVYGFFIRQRPLDDIAQITRSGAILCPAHLELAKLDTLLGKGVNVVTRLRQALHAPGVTPGPVVIDCCPLLNVLSLNAIFAADLLLVPVSADFLSLKGAEQVERALNALEPVFKRRLPRRYVVTRYDVGRRMSADVVERMDALLRADEICVTRIRESVKLAESPSVGLDIFRHAPGSRGAYDYAALYDELLGAGLLH
jgi:chromosome partitioning protein